MVTQVENVTIQQGIRDTSFVNKSNTTSINTQLLFGQQIPLQNKTQNDLKTILSNSNSANIQEPISKSVNGATTPINTAKNTQIHTPTSNPFANLSNFIRNIQKNVNEYDAAVNHALKHLPSEGDLKIIVESNPRIKAILTEAGLQNIKLNYDNLKTIKHSHIATTVQYARAIGKSLGMSPDELQTMEVGAALHDIGKTLIPAEILNKQGQLTPEERRIVNYHSILGYEILKSTGKNVNVAEIARDHHNPFSKNKYAQIVRAADVYSAMTEKRSYKEAKSHDEAMKVLKSMKINPEILDALENEYGKSNPKNQETSAQLARV